MYLFIIIEKWHYFIIVIDKIFEIVLYISLIRSDDIFGHVTMHMWVMLSHFNYFL